MAKNVEISGSPASEPNGNQHVNPRSYLPAIVLVSATLFFAYDIASDILDGTEGRLHITMESLVFLAVSTVLFLELRRVRLLRRQVQYARHKNARLTGELLGVMRSEFAEWGLSPSESDVALLLIKGLSMREISEARDVKEKTVRQQATGVYAKSGCAGRHELVARFIEDLMSEGVDRA
jgi:DNA-binding CsgD family transcriptional regulator